MDTMTKERAKELARKHATPLFVYDAALLRERAKALTELRLPYGLTVRYAMKANPHPEIIRIVAAEGLQFDASSSYEAAQLLEQGIAGKSVSLSSQQPAHNLPELLKADIVFVATSMRQLELFVAVDGHPKTVGLRVNPGM